MSLVSGARRVGWGPEYDRFGRPASRISWLGAGAGLQKATVCPRLTNSLAMRKVRVGKQRSFEKSVVNKILMAHLRLSASPILPGLIHSRKVSLSFLIPWFLIIQLSIVESPH